jgi:CO/xanthine dehydrogenase Mo-binding subunit
MSAATPTSPGWRWSTHINGRILNENLACSQITGAVVMGIGMTLLEETIFDGMERVANATFGDYPPR